MATPGARSAYELLLQAIQQQKQRQPNLGFGSTLSSVPDSGSPQGGLLGLLLASQSIQNRQQGRAVNSQSTPQGLTDPNFRQLARFVQPPAVIAPSIVPDGFDNLGPAADGSTIGPLGEQYVGRKPTMSECVDRCLHLLPSPSGDLQSMEYHQCITKCMAGEL